MNAPTFDDVMEYVAAGWQIFPLRGKLPAIARSRGGRGLLDATGDLDQLRRCWRPGYNIGGRVPDGVIVVDTDPRHGGEDNLNRLAEVNGGMPPTLTALSGRGDGGRHRYLLHPGGKLSGRRLPTGVDLKTHAGYVVLPPSLHPASGRPYHWEEADMPIATCPAWLAGLLREAQRAPRPITVTVAGADRYTARAVDKIAARIGAAPPGQHHWVLNAEAYGVGRLVAGGLLGEQQGLDLLHQAAAALCPKDHRSSIDAGFAAGRRSPLGLVAAS